MFSIRTKPIKDTEGILIYPTLLPQGDIQWHIRPPSSIRAEYEERLNPSNVAIPTTSIEDLTALIQEMSRKKLGLE